MTSGTNLSLANHLAADYAAKALRKDVAHGLSQTPKTLPPKWFYDATGSDLFDQITRLPEYYPTESEREILLTRADEIAEITRADTLVELGSGTSDKTRALLDALDATGRLRRFVPFDVSEQTLRDAATMLAERHPGLHVHGVVGDFHEHLAAVPSNGFPVLAFLGSTIGNFYPEERARFLDQVAAWLTPDAWFLLGFDLV
jgi:L-histidine N-alpha-methyltransferase